MNLYGVLGVEKTATQDEIKRAYRKLALKCHPDRQTGATDEQRGKAKEMWEALEEAHRILGDPDERKKYDTGATAPCFDPESIFDLVFSLFADDFGDLGDLGDGEVTVTTTGAGPEPKAAKPKRRKGQCRDGVACTKFGCKFSHPPERKGDCRSGAKCTREDCWFQHPERTAKASAPRPNGGGGSKESRGGAAEAAEAPGRSVARAVDKRCGVEILLGAKDLELIPAERAGDTLLRLTGSKGPLKPLLAQLAVVSVMTAKGAHVFIMTTAEARLLKEKKGPVLLATGGLGWVEAVPSKGCFYFSFRSDKTGEAAKLSRVNGLVKPGTKLSKALIPYFYGGEELAFANGWWYWSLGVPGQSAPAQPAPFFAVVTGTEVAGGGARGD